MTSSKFNGDISGQEFNRFMLRTIKYPQSAIDEIIEGKVVVQFRMDTLGYVTDIKIIKSLGEDFDEEVIKALKLSPRWIPASINNKSVSQTFTYPARFTNDRSTIKEDRAKNKK